MLRMDTRFRPLPTGERWCWGRCTYFTSPRGRGREPGAPCEAWLRHDAGVAGEGVQVYRYSVRPLGLTRVQGWDGTTVSNRATAGQLL